METLIKSLSEAILSVFNANFAQHHGDFFSPTVGDCLHYGLPADQNINGNMSRHEIAARLETDSQSPVHSLLRLFDEFPQYSSALCLDLKNNAHHRANILAELLVDWAHILLNRTFRIGSKQLAVDGIVREIGSFISNPTITIRMVTPIAGLRFEDNLPDFRIAPNCTLKRLSISERQAFKDPKAKLFGMDVETDCNIALDVSVTESLVNIPLSPTVVISKRLKAQETLSRKTSLLLAGICASVDAARIEVTDHLCLCTPQIAYRAARIYLVHSEHPRPIRYRDSPLMGGTFRHLGQIRASQQPHLLQFLSALVTGPKLDDSVSAAIYRLQKSYLRVDNIDAFLDCYIGFEALLGGGAGRPATMALSYACLGTYTERNERFERFRKFTESRNGIVHGREKPLDVALVVSARESLRELILLSVVKRPQRNHPFIEYTQTLAKNPFADLSDK